MEQVGLNPIARQDFNLLLMCMLAAITMLYFFDPSTWSAALSDSRVSLQRERHHHTRVLPLDFPLVP
jgi:hypothetical protein